MEYYGSVLILDAFVRFSGITLLLFLIASMIFNIRSSKTIVYLFISCISLLGLFIGLVPEYLQLPQAVYIISRLVDIPHLVFIWLFSLSLFHREFMLSSGHIIVGLVYCLPILIVRFAQFGLLPEIEYWWVMSADVFGFILMGHLIFVALKGRSDDLSEKSRSSRVGFVIVISVIAILTTLSEVWIVGTDREYIGTVKTVIIFPGVVCICFWLLSFNHQLLAFEIKRTLRQPDLSSKEELLLSGLNDAMISKKLYLNSNITIESLAKTLLVSPHQLRKLINQQLGYKNFSTFVNGYRIESIKKELSDPSQFHIPILTIALDNGFASLSPFNKAFLAREGVTPSKYRRSFTENS